MLTIPWRLTVRTTGVRNPDTDFDLVVSQLQSDGTTLVALETHRNLSMDEHSSQYVRSVVNNASTTIQGLEPYKQFISMYFTAFPDARLTIEDIIAEGDSVVARHTFRGTQQGDLMGIAPTGKQVMTTGITITRFANGKGVELWGNNDDLGLLQQLGVVPTMG